MEIHRPRLRAGILGALWAAVSLAAVLSPGCYGRNCESSVATFEGDGVMIDDRTWASTSVASNWLPFPGQRTWIFDIPALGDRTPELQDVLVSSTTNPTSTGLDFAPGAGNLAEVLGIRPGGITIYNDSCSMLYLRLVLHVPPYPPAAALLDGGTVEVVDAGPDAPIEDAKDDGGGG